MRVLTYYKDFRQQVHMYCFDMINVLKERIQQDQKELAFFEQLQREQARCKACNGEGTIRVCYDMNESTTIQCEGCKGTGSQS